MRHGRSVPQKEHKNGDQKIALHCFSPKQYLKMIMNHSQAITLNIFVFSETGTVSVLLLTFFFIVRQSNSTGRILKSMHRFYPKCTFSQSIKFCEMCRLMMIKIYVIN